MITKFKTHLVSDQKPKAGDTMICIQKKNVNYGKTTIVTPEQIGFSIPLDTTNWKVLIPDHISTEALRLLKLAQKVHKQYRANGTYWKVAICLEGIFKLENAKGRACKVAMELAEEIDRKDLLKA